MICPNPTEQDLRDAKILKEQMKRLLEGFLDAHPTLTVDIFAESIYIKKREEYERKFSLLCGTFIRYKWYDLGYEKPSLPIAV